MATSAVDLAVDALAVHRLTRLAVSDEITAGLRERLWERHDPATTGLGYLATCPWCASFWIAAAVAAARAAAPRAWAPLAAVLAMSSAAGLLSER